MKKVFKQDGDRKMVIFDDLTEMSFDEYRKQNDKKEDKKKEYKKETVTLQEASDILDTKE